MYFAPRLEAIFLFSAIIAIVGLPPDTAAAQAVIPFQQQKDANCAATNCRLTFSVPAGERREINTISCNARITPNNAPIRIAFLAALNQNESTLGAHFLVPIQHGTATTSSYNSMNHQLYLFAPSNGKFEVVVFTDTAPEVAMVCGISGQRIQ